jgi:hypothetical protein
MRCDSLMNSAYNSENEDIYLNKNRFDVDMPANSECSEEIYQIHSE